MQHDDFKANEEFIKLHAVKRYFCVTEEGDPNQVFDDPGTGHAGEEAHAQVPLRGVVANSINGHLKRPTQLQLFMESLTLMMTMNWLPTMFQGQQTVLIGHCHQNGVTLAFAVALIKRRYWPKHVPGDEIIQHFAENDVRDADTIKDTMDAIPFCIHAMKEPDYVMMLMSTYGMLLSMGETKKQHITVDGIPKDHQEPLQISRHDQQSQLFSDASYLNGGNLDDNEVGQPCVLFPSGGNGGQCPKCGCILLEQARIECFAILSTNYNAIDI